MLSNLKEKARALVGCGLVGALSLVLAACGGGGGGSDDVKSYRIGGQVSGLTAAGLTLTNNGATPLEVSNGATSFVFPGEVREGSSFNVTVGTQPAGLICTVTNGSGTVRGTVTDIRVACQVETHSVAGSITGLIANGLVLQMNGADDLAVPSGATSFEFATPIAAGSGYNVTVLSQPAGLTCSVGNGSGTNINADISNVQVVCSVNTHTVGGGISGLSVPGLVLQINGADDLAPAASSTTFEFASPVAYNSIYNVTVRTQPIGLSCTIANGGGIVRADVTNILVTCATVPTYIVTATAGFHGSISPNGAINVNEGGNLGFIATADSGYFVERWLVDGVPVQNGGSVYTLSNATANRSVHVTFSDASLSASVSTLALSVNRPATNPALTGSPRSIVITNNGTTTTATNLHIATPVFPNEFPMGTSISSSTCGSSLAPGGSCTITITPGSAETSACAVALSPVPSMLTVSADNAASLSVGVVVVGYRCYYQGGYLFAIDDTTPPTSSIGGKVASDTARNIPVSGSIPASVVWSSNGLGPDAANVDYANLGIDENSLAPCAGAHDGACNSTTIVSHYPSAMFPPTYFAAGQCDARTAYGFSDWYLPALCEFHTCVAGAQSIEANVSSLTPFAGRYWTSTEHSGDPSHAAYAVEPSLGTVSFLDKSTQAEVRCARALTP